LALFGFSSCKAFWMLILWAIPYGLGAGGIDSALNNYVALHYESRHMSWFHCMWGIGAATGPYVMGYALSGGMGWPTGYRIIGVLQIVLTVIVVLSLPIWKKRTAQASAKSKALPLREIFKIPGAKEVLLAFFCYCAIESTAGLWASSYLVLYKGVPSERAASFASMFFIGITAGRAANGFIADRFTDTALTRIGFVVMGLGVVVLLIPAGEIAAMAGLVILGVGCAPTYPCIIHATPIRFGREKSQAFIGVQMASAYLGTTLMPPLFGLIANHISVGLYPVYLTAVLLLMVLMHERVIKATEQ
jgi:fucose permease